MASVVQETQATIQYGTGEPFVRWTSISSSVNQEGVPSWTQSNHTFRIALDGQGSGWFSAKLYYGCNGSANARASGVILSPVLKLQLMNYSVLGTPDYIQELIANYTAIGLNFSVVLSQGGQQADFSEWIYSFNVSFVFHSPVDLSIQLGTNLTSPVEWTPLENTMLIALLMLVAGIIGFIIGFKVLLVWTEKRKSF